MVYNIIQIQRKHLLNHPKKMKKISSKSRQRQKNQRIKRMKKDCWQKRSRQVRKSTGIRLSAKKRLLTNQGEFSINHDIDIYNDDNRQALSKICRGIRRFQGNHIHLSFQQGEIKISATGMLWLYAEIFRKIDEGKTKITCNYPSDKKAEQVLQHIGFFKKIGKAERISNDEIQKTDKNIHSWHVLSDSTDNGYDPKMVQNFLEKITDPTSPDISKINIATKELIANVIYHAYDKPDLLNDDKPDLLKRWIIFGRVEKESLIIVLGDLGKTIPVTIKDNDLLKQIIDRGDWAAHRRIMKNDSRLIEYAISTEGTKTKEKHRGKGLEEAIKNIKALQGDLAIYSRKGLYKPLLSRQEKRDWKKKTKIEGTIAEIKIPLNLD